MNKSIKTISKLILKDSFLSFEEFHNDYITDLESFKKKHRKMLLKWFDKEDFDEIEGLSTEYILIYYGQVLNKIYSVDWSGEYYPGQVKSTITKMLNTYGKPTFKWDLKKFESKLDYDTIKRGEYIGLLFRAFDAELLKMGFQLLFIELFDDEYHYSILPKSEISNALDISGDSFSTYDSKIYSIKITDTGKNKAKLMSYLKKKHDVQLKDIKNYITNLPILVENGCNIIRIKSIEKQLKEIECKYEINAE